MKKLRKFLIGLLIVILVFIIIAFFLPRQAHVKRSLTMDAPAKVVFNQVNNLHTWDKWAVWNQMDPNMEITYHHTGIGENASYSWHSDNSNVGSGEMKITASVPYDSIATAMDFMEHGTATGYFLFDENDGKTNVTWAFDTDLGFNPMARWLGLFMNAMLGPDFEKGLENLKIVSETIVQEKRPIVEIVTRPAFHFVSLRKEVDLKDISTQMGRMYAKLTTFINQNNLLMTNMPYAIYHKIDGDMVDIECGIPIDKVVEQQDNILSGTVPATKCAEADHIGPYSTLEKTHQFIQDWIPKNGFHLAGSPMERYLTDPQKEPDQSKWITTIYYPVN